MVLSVRCYDVAMSEMEQSETERPSGYASKVKKIKQRRHDMRIFKRYMAGETQAELASAFGTTQQSVSRALYRVVNARKPEQVEQAKTLDLMRIERYLNKLEELEHDNPYLAIQTAIRVLQRRAAIYGYDAPKMRVNVEGSKVNYSIEGVDMDKL